MRAAHSQTLTTRCVARRSLLGFALLAAVLAPAVLGSHRVAGELSLALGQLGSADRGWLVAATMSFAASLAFAVVCWWIVTRSCGARGGRLDAFFRFGVGAIVQVLTPARLGDAVRVALYARTVDEESPVLRVGGAYAMLEAARAVALGLMLAVAWLFGGMSFWPVAIVAAIATVVVGVALATARRTRGGRLARLFAAARELRADPRAALLLVAAACSSTVMRVLGASALAAAVGIHSPLAAGLVACCAVDLAGLLPVTPGNVGIAGGAIAVALAAQGVTLTSALALGMLFQGAETAVAVAVGAVSLCGLGGLPARPRRVVLVAGAAAAAGAAATLGVTLFA